MAHITIHTPNVSKTPLTWLARIFRSEPVNVARPAKDPHVGAKAALLDAIDHGYTIKDTGEIARLPRFARTHLRTMVDSSFDF